MHGVTRIPKVPELFRNQSKFLRLAWIYTEAMGFVKYVRSNLPESINEQQEGKFEGTTANSSLAE